VTRVPTPGFNKTGLPLARHGDSGGPASFSTGADAEGHPAADHQQRGLGLRFFFTVTLDRPDLARRLTVVPYPRRIPVVLSVEEVTLLLRAATGPKYKAAFGTAYDAGLRVSEVVALKVGDSIPRACCCASSAARNARTAMQRCPHSSSNCCVSGGVRTGGLLSRRLTRSTFNAPVSSPTS
jgi:hypothetical protein